MPPTYIRNISILVLMLAILGISFVQLTAPTAQAAPRVQTQTIELIRNGNFESGSNGEWIEESTEFDQLIYSSAPEGVEARSGEYIAWLGDASNETSRLAQTITIPPSSDVVLTFYYWIISDEPECDATDNYVIGLGLDGIFSSLCSAAETSGWALETINLGNFSTQTNVTIEFIVRTDSGYDSHLLIDDVSVVAKVEPSILSVSPQSLSFRAIAGDLTTTEQSIQLAKNGTPSVDWTVSTDRPWINVAPLSGTDSGTLAVSLNLETLSPGGHAGNIFINAPTANPPQLTISITIYLRGSIDVGVVPGSDGCEAGLERVELKMDDEDDISQQGPLGWVGATRQEDGATVLVFCRVNGRDFKSYGVPPGEDAEALRYGYALLKLGDDCPDGSKPFSRYIDNQDKRRASTFTGYKTIGNKNSSWGNIYPNSVENNGNTTLWFCYFPGVNTDDGKPFITEFPPYYMDYGVLANQDFFPALETGQAWYREESHDNRSGTSIPADFTEAERLNALLIVHERDDNTLFRMAKVYDVPADENPILCPTTKAFCRANPRPIDLAISFQFDVSAAEEGTYEQAINYFADAIFEMTNGTHIVRRVHMFERGANAHGARAVWAHGDERASASMCGMRGGPISMFDEANAINAGYTLAHEMGHHYFALPDEYREQDEDNCDANASQDSMPRCDDNPVEPSIMNAQYNGVVNIDWLNFSSNGATAWDGKNAQARVYEATGWATIARSPVDDPRTAQISTICPPPPGDTCKNAWYTSNDGSCIPNPTEWGDAIDEFLEPGPLNLRSVRRYYPEMAETAPLGASLPSTELPSQQTEARAKLKIVWWRQATQENHDLPLLDTHDAASAASVKRPVQVEAGLDSVKVRIEYIGEANSNVTLIFRDPNGQEKGRQNCPSSTTDWQQCSITINQPMAGRWEAEVAIAAPPVGIEWFISGVKRESQPLRAHVGSLTSNPLIYPNAAIIVAHVQGSSKVARLGVQAQVVTPSGGEQTLVLRDDGVSPDGIADDGLYSGRLSYRQDGDHLIVVNFDNNAGTAVFTTLGQGDGSILKPVGFNFNRSARVTVQIQGYRNDDHGNTSDTATTLPTNNVEIPGRIDAPGDKDLIKFEPTVSGPIAIRLPGLTPGMKPEITITRCDDGTLIKHAKLTTVEDMYLLTIIDAQAGIELCIEVKHQDTTASDEHYHVGVGPLLPSEIDTTIHTKIVQIGPNSTYNSVTEVIVYQVESYIGEGNANGDGVVRVIMRILGPDGIMVHERVADTPSYCAFGGNPCAGWSFAENANRWPNGAAVQAGLHTLVTEVHSRDNRVETFYHTFTITLPDDASIELYMPSVRSPQPCDTWLTKTKIWEGSLTIQCDSSVTRNGLPTLKLQADSPSIVEAYSSLIAVQPNTLYRVSYWVQGDIEVDGAEIYGRMVAAEYSNQARESDEMNVNRISTGFELGENVGNQIWVRKSYTFRTNEHTSYVRLRAIIGGPVGTASGTMWLSDITFAEE